MITPLLSKIYLSNNLDRLIYRMNVSEPEYFVPGHVPVIPLMYRLHHLVGIVDLVKSRIDQEVPDIASKGGYYKWANDLCSFHLAGSFSLCDSILKHFKLNELIERKFESDPFDTLLNMMAVIDSRELEEHSKYLLQSSKEFIYLKGLFRL